MMNLRPKRHPEALKDVSRSPDFAGEGGGAFYAAFSEARSASRPVTLGQAAQAYNSYLTAKGHVKSSLKGVRNLLSAFYRLTGLKESTPLVSVSPAAAERFMLNLPSKYGPNTAYSYSGRILSLFRIFSSGGLILENPFARIDPLPKPKRLMGPTLSPDEVNALMAAPDFRLPASIRYRAMMEVMYSTAIRLAECLALHLDDVDFAKGTIVVREGKGGKGRVVPLGKDAARWIGRYLSEVRPRYAHKDDDALWISQHGKAVAPSTVQVMIKRMRRKAGIRKTVTPHTLRRTCVTHLLSAGASPWVVKEILGHGDAKTLNRYLAVTPKELKHAHEQTHPRG